MIWDKLVDRCLLFTNSPGGLIKELLKEAEIELSNRLEIYDSIFTLEVPTTTSGMGVRSNKASSVADHNYHKLPDYFIRDISVTHEGRKLRKMTESEIYRQSGGELTSGTPTAYGISGDYIIFDTIPESGDKFYILYKSLLDSSMKSKVLTILNYNGIVGSGGDFIWLDTTLGALLDAQKFVFEDTFYVLASGTTSGTGAYSIPPGVPDKYNSNIMGKGVALGTSHPHFLGSRYTLATDISGGSASDAINNIVGGLCQVLTYRDIAPLIPNRFHINLCDYAIAIANAKTSPALYDKYWTMWELNMERLDNQARDRDLIHSVREEI